MMSAMARELVERGGVGETADDVWRQVNQQREAQFGNTAPALVAPVDSDVPTKVVEQPLVEEDATLKAAIAVAEAFSETPVSVPTPTPAPSLFDFARAPIAKRRKRLHLSTPDNSCCLPRKQYPFPFSRAIHSIHSHL